MDNQQPSREKRKVQRPSREGVHHKLLMVEVVGIHYVDEDMVYSLVKAKEAVKAGGV